MRRLAVKKHDITRAKDECQNYDFSKLDHMTLEELLTEFSDINVKLLLWKRSKQYYIDGVASNIEKNYSNKTMDRVMKKIAQINKIIDTMEVIIISIEKKIINKRYEVVA